MVCSRRCLAVGELSFKENMIYWLSRTFLVWKPMISHLQRRGIQVYLWVCNSEDEFKACESIGATGIMTDRPTLLRKFLDNQEDKE